MCVCIKQFRIDSIGWNCFYIQSDLHTLLQGSTFISLTQNAYLSLSNCIVNLYTYIKYTIPMNKLENECSVLAVVMAMAICKMNCGRLIDMYVKWKLINTILLAKSIRYIPFTGLILSPICRCMK